MEKIYSDTLKELKLIEEQGGLNAQNLEVVEKLSTIAKNLAEVKEEDREEMRMYREGGYNDRYSEYGGRYMDRYNDRYNDYGRRYMDRSSYGHGHFDDHLERLMDCIEQYEYGKTRYRSGGDENRMVEGLEKMMYAVCGFVETAMDFAETPEEKEIIRKHVQKIKTI